MHLIDIYEFVNLNKIRLQQLGNCTKQVWVFEPALISTFLKNQTQWSHQY